MEQLKNFTPIDPANLTLSDALSFAAGDLRGVLTEIVQSANNRHSNTVIEQTEAA